MTREERKAIVEEYNSAKKMLPQMAIGLNRVIDYIPLLLNTLEVAENVKGGLEVENYCLKNQVRALESDLFHEKYNGEIAEKRAAALEAAIKAYMCNMEDFHPGICNICSNKPKTIDDVNICRECYNKKYADWVFDEERFTKGARENEV